MIAATRPIAEDFASPARAGRAHVPNAWDPDLDPGAGPARQSAATRVELVHTGKMSGGWGRDPSALFAALRRRRWSASPR